MKTVITTIGVLILFAIPSFSQNSLQGTWEGGITVPNGQLKIVFKINEIESGYEGTLDIPQQETIGLGLDPIVQNGDSVSMVFSAGQITGTFSGAFTSETNISGNYSQGGPIIPFSIERISLTTEAPPQPKNETDLIIKNGEIEIGGTLTMPDGEVEAPLMIMISGSGAQNRDSNIYDFKIFQIIAQHLAKNGIPSFRYDDRGVGESTGDFNNATLDDLASDVNAIIEHFVDQDRKFESFALLGHSQGGVVAGKVATNNKFVTQLILMGSTAPSLSEILRYQVEFAYSTSPVDKMLVQSEINAREELMKAIAFDNDIDAAKANYNKSYTEVLNSLPDAQRNSIPDIPGMVNRQTQQLTSIYSSPQIKSLLFYVPTEDLEKASVPTLVLFGEKDTQVTITQNQAKIREALEKSGTDYEIKIFESANHLFQKAETGSASEYPILDKAFVGGFLEYISNWMTNN